MALKATKPTAKTPVVKTEVKKEEVKPAVKETAKVAVKEAAPKKAEPAKKAPAKRAPKKATAPKEIKTNIVLEVAGDSLDEKEIVKIGKAAWKKAGNKIGDIKSLVAYIQPENRKIYYVINGVALEGDGESF